MLRRSVQRPSAACSSPALRVKPPPQLLSPCPPLPYEAVLNPNTKSIMFYPENPAEPPRMVSLNVMLDDLHEALRAYQRSSGFGRGLAAPQIGYNSRVLVMCLDCMQHTLINPEWTNLSAQKWTMWDNCFMFPDTVVRVSRHVNGTLSHTTRDGGCEEWLGLPFAISELLQHEIDHLDAKVSHDRVAPVELPKDHQFYNADFVVDGQLTSMPRAIFNEHKAEFMKLVSPLHSEPRVAGVVASHKIVRDTWKHMGM